MRNQTFFYGWWIVLSCAIIALWGGGLFYGISAFFNPIVDEFGWTYMALSLVISLRNVELGLLAPIVGFLTDRFGPRKVTFCGTCIAALGFFLLSRVNALTTFYIAFIILSIGLTGYSQVTTTIAVANWFNRKVGRATGLAVAGYGAGGILMPLIVWLIESYGWRMSLVVLGLGTCLVIFPFSLLLRHKPEQYGLIPDGERLDSFGMTGNGIKTLSLKENNFTTRRALKTKTFWLLGLAFATQLMAVSAISVHIMPHYASVGVSEALAALIVMFIPLSSIIGRLSFGWLADLFEKRYLLVAGLFLQALGLIFFYDGRAMWQHVIFLFFFGPASGGLVAIRSVILREYFGRLAFGSIQGLITAVMTVGGIIGTVYAGWIFDVRGRYHEAWLTLAIAILIVIPVVLTMRKPTSTDHN